MKYALIIITFLVLCFAGYFFYSKKPLTKGELIAQNYSLRIEKCQKDLSDKINAQDTISHEDIINMSYATNECYETIAYEIIDNYYTKNAVEIKTKLSDFIKISCEISSALAFERDYCRPFCGTMYTEIYINNSGLLLKQLLEDMISYIRIDYN